jgi:hypothetical protein
MMTDTWEAEQRKQGKPNAVKQAKESGPTDEQIAESWGVDVAEVRRSREEQPESQMSEEEAKKITEESIPSHDWTEEEKANWKG